LFWSSVNDIPLRSGKELVRRLRKGKPVLSAEDVARLAGIADARLCPAASDGRPASCQSTAPRIPSAIAPSSALGTLVHAA
jgi:hypothetical protein